MREDHNSPQEENSLVPQSDETQALVQKGIEIEQPDTEDAGSEEEQTPEVSVEKREGTAIYINFSPRMIIINNSYNTYR